MTWLASLPTGVLVAGSLVFAILVAAASRTTIRALVPEAERDHVQAIAAPLMPALGATFAVLMGLTLASEAAYLRSAQDIVSTEAAEASRLAWSATGEGVATAPVQAALGEYLRATRAGEWRGGESAERADSRTALALVALQRTVRIEAARAELGTPRSTQLLASLDALTMARRDRLAAASHELPVLYVVTLIASGAALIVNAGALTFQSSVRTSLLVAGLAAAVALSLALLFALSAPWDGSLIVNGQPIDAILRDLEAGFFRS